MGEVGVWERGCGSRADKQRGHANCRRRVATPQATPHSCTPQPPPSPSLTVHPTHQRGEPLGKDGVVAREEHLAALEGLYFGGLGEAQAR